MSLSQTINELLLEFSTRKYCGVHGPTEGLGIPSHIEQVLGVQLPEEVREFINRYGAIQFGPNEYLGFVPSPGGLDGCLEWTQQIRAKHPEISPSLIVIVEDDSLYYLLDTASGKVFAWNRFLPPQPRNFHAEFPNLEEFIRHLAHLAR